MPGIDGLQTAVSINAKVGKKHLPVIIMVTAHDRIALLEHPSYRFVDAIISKPITTSALFNVVLEVKIKKSSITFNNLRDPNNQRLKGVKILVVDDNETNREVAYQILGGENATVEGVENGQEALVRLMAKPDYFDVVLMDVQMPVMDGYAATREIRRIAELKTYPLSP
jgi:CheY-like chemotaxis protein